MHKWAHISGSSVYGPSPTGEDSQWPDRAFNSDWSGKNTWHTNFDVCHWLEYHATLPLSLTGYELTSIANGHASSHSPHTWQLQADERSEPVHSVAGEEGWKYTGAFDSHPGECRQYRLGRPARCSRLQFRFSQGQPQYSTGPDAECYLSIACVSLHGHFELQEELVLEELSQRALQGRAALCVLSFLYEQVLTVT